MQQQKKIIWFAIVFSTVLYLGVLLATGKNPVRPFEESVRQQLTLILYAAAVVMFFVASIVPARLGPADKSMIVAMAMFESCAISGLVAAFLGHDWRLYLAPWALALIGFVRNFPSE